MLRSSAPCDDWQMRRGLALVVMCGCSLATSDCTNSRIVPILVAVFTAVMALTMVEALTSTSTPWHLDCEVGDTASWQPVGAAVFGTLTVVGGASLWFGFTRVGQCRDARRAAAVPPAASPIVQPPRPRPPTGSNAGSDTPPISTTGLLVPGAP